MKRNNEILTNYISDVMDHPENARIDLAALNEEYRMLGEYIKRLSDWAMEIRTSLENVTRQIEQIMNQNSETDHSIFAEYGYDFDKVVQELHRRTSALENERNLFVQFTESASERIVVLDEETGEMLFANKVARNYRDRTRGYVDEADSLNAQSGCSENNPYSKWMNKVIHPDENGEMVEEHFQVHSIYIIWENRGAIAHMFSNVTDIQKIHNQAITDALTGCYNRSYSMEYLNRIYEEKKEFAIGFVDIDYLKYCNDTFGHGAGDAYLLQIAGLLQGLGDDTVVCRTGGDEFLVISEAMTEQELTQVLQQARQSLRGDYFDEDKKIHKSFSFGVISRGQSEGASLQKILSDADEKMYQNKLENKRENHLHVRDSRL